MSACLDRMRFRATAQMSNIAAANSKARPSLMFRPMCGGLMRLARGTPSVDIHVRGVAICPFAVLISSRRTGLVLIAAIRRLARLGTLRVDNSPTQRKVVFCLGVGQSEYPQ
jgi:hypothetical protein